MKNILINLFLFLFIFSFSKGNSANENDIYKKPEEIPAEDNYIDKVGTGYGWILILIGLAIFSIIFYVYLV